MAWVSVDLGTAVFGLINGQPSGQYVDGKIVHANDRWTDVWFPGLVLEPGRVYTFELEYENAAPGPEAGSATNWSGMYGMTAPTQTAYDASGWWEFAATRSGNVLTLTVGPGVGDYDQNLADGAMVPFFELQKFNALVGLRYSMSTYESGALVPLDSTPAEQSEYPSNYYAAGCALGDGIAVMAWTDDRQRNHEMYEVRAVRWTESLELEVGPLAVGPSSWWDEGYFMAPRMGWVARINATTALIVPNDYAPLGTLGWLVAVDPVTLAITNLGAVHWSNAAMQSQGYSQVVQHASSAGVFMNVDIVDGSPSDTQATTYAALSRATGQRTQEASWIYSDDHGSVGYFMAQLTSLARLNDGRFIATAMLAEDLVPAVGTSGQFGYQPQWTKTSIWVMDAAGDVPSPDTRQRVATINDKADFDGVYVTVLPNGKVHYFIDFQNRYLYAGDSDTAKSELLELDPTTWTFSEPVSLPWVSNGTSGHLMDYMSLHPMTEGTSLWHAMFGGSSGGGGYTVGTFDGQGITQHAVPDLQWSSGSVWRYSDEAYPVGGDRWIGMFNGDLYGGNPYGEDFGQVWAFAGRTGEDIPVPAEITADFDFEVQDNGIVVDFDASASGPDIVSYTWNFGDPLNPLPTVVEEPTTAYTFSVPMTYQVTLTVANAAGQTASVTKPVTIEPEEITGLAGPPLVRFYPA